MIQVHAERKIQKGIDWTYCKIARILVDDYKGDCDGETNPARINYPHTVFESMLLSGIGVLIFLAFGLDFSLFLYFNTIWKYAREKRWRKIMTLIAYGAQCEDVSKIGQN
jgi:hypothetical protein